MVRCILERILYKSIERAVEAGKDGDNEQVIRVRENTCLGEVERRGNKTTLFQCETLC